MRRDHFNFWTGRAAQELRLESRELVGAIFCFVEMSAWKVFDFKNLVSTPSAFLCDGTLMIMKQFLCSFRLFRAGALLVGSTLRTAAVLGADAAEPSPAALTGPTVSMQPFKVMAAWLTIQPVLKDGLINHVRIVEVVPKTPAATAGVQAGMRIIEWQGVRVVGISESEFITKLEQLPAADRMTLRVRQTGNRNILKITVHTNPRIKAEIIEEPEVLFVRKTEASTEADTKAQIAAVKAAIDNDRKRRIDEAAAKSEGGKTVRIKPADDKLREEAMRALSDTPPEHVILLCNAAVIQNEIVEEALAKGARRIDNPGAVLINTEASMLRRIFIETITQRGDYGPEQKAVILKFLPQLPDLIVTVERMNWSDGAEAAIAAGWKKARENKVNGALGLQAVRYARVAARLGVTDALLALARAMRDEKSWMSGKNAEPVRRTNAATLKVLVPLESVDGMALADFVLKNKDRLIFDATQKSYVLKP